MTSSGSAARASASAPARVGASAPERLRASAPERLDASAPPSLTDPCLQRFDVVIEAARRLGIPVAEAEAVRATAVERLGFPSDAYVVALVGGTGVGKSSLLNGLAGTAVSPATVRRPTTSRPVAWLPADAADLAGLLDWLGVEDRDVHRDSPGQARLAILDLPDLDSTSTEHRRRVEALLPRVDAVVWVTDPEKYADAILHDEFLRAWLPRLDRQVIVLNKVDRLTAADTERVRRDLESDVASLVPDRRRGERPVAVLVTSVPPDQRLGGDRDGVEPLRAWLASEREAKSIVRGRIRATIRDAATSLAAAAGAASTSADDADAPLLASGARTAALDDAQAALLRIIDLAELRRQAVAATRARARGSGAGPLGGLTSLIYRWSGRQARVADPAGFLARWRDRGTLRAAVEPIRAAVAEPLRRASPAVRHRLASAFDAAAVETSLGRSVDRAVVTAEEPPPGSVVWPLLGLLQTLVTLGLVATVAWVVLWVLVHFPVDTVALPLVGHAPTPLVALLVLLAAGYGLARLLGAHAGWLGRRWADHLAAEVRANLARDVAAAAFGPLDAVEADRSALGHAVDAVRADCGA